MTQLKHSYFFHFLIDFIDYDHKILTEAKISIIIPAFGIFGATHRLSTTQNRKLMNEATYCLYQTTKKQIAQTKKQRERENKILLSGGGVDHLTDGEGNHGGLPRPGLGLRDDVAAIDDGHDGALLDGRRLLEPVRVDPPQQVIPDPHLVEARHRLHPRARLERQPVVVDPGVAPRRAVPRHHRWAGRRRRHSSPIRLRFSDPEDVKEHRRDVLLCYFVNGSR